MKNVPIGKFVGSRFIFSMLIVLLIASGCSQGAPATSEPPPQSAPPPASAEQPAPAPAPQKSELEELYEAAKKEGKLVISGAPSERYRDALVAPFQAKYPGIEVEYVGSNGRDFWPRVVQERKVEQYLWDLRMGGPDALGWKESREITQPIRPLLLPENSDESKWLGGLNGLFVDAEEQYIPGFLAYPQSPVSVNRAFISEAELSSPEQLLDPKFKGKIVINDPRGGAGLGYLTVLLEAYGEEFVSKLLTEQDVVVTSDNRQLVEWVVRGNYPIGIGFDSTNLEMFQSQGLGLEIKELEEGPVGLSMGFGAIIFLDKAPNPNASKLYINWLLSQEGQAKQVELLELNTRRLDVPITSSMIPLDVNNMDRYIAHQEEEFVEIRTKAQNLARQLIK